VRGSVGHGRERVRPKRGEAKAFAGRAARNLGTFPQGLPPVEGCKEGVDVEFGYWQVKRYEDERLWANDIRD